jgi:hypothetical protein
MSSDQKEWLPRWMFLVTAVLAFVAIGDLPYSYYRFLRWIVCAVAVAAAIQFRDRPGWPWAFAMAALLFNPIFPFHFEKAVWRFIDGGAGLVFLLAFSKMKTALR